MGSRPAFRRATTNFSMPQLVEVVAYIVRVWPLLFLVLYLNETGRKDDGDSLAVRSFSFYCTNKISDSFSLFFFDI